MKPAVLISLFIVMAGLAFAQAPPIVTPVPTVLPTAFERGHQPFSSPSALPTPAKVEPPKL